MSASILSWHCKWDHHKDCVGDAGHDEDYSEELQCKCTCHTYREEKMKTRLYSEYEVRGMLANIRDYNCKLCNTDFESDYKSYMDHFRDENQKLQFTQCSNNSKPNRESIVLAVQLLAEAVQAEDHGDMSRATLLERAAHEVWEQKIEERS